MTLRVPKHRVVVWGTGNAGRPAIRAVAAHADLELVGVVVSNPAKVGRDAGELAFIEPLGVLATDDTSVATGGGVDAVVYTATADTRPDDAFADLVACLESGANVVSTSFYPLLHPASAPAPVVEAIERACATGDSSVFVSGIDPGWALDILPILVSGVSAGIEEIRVQEIFNYALYDAPDVVREVIGFGGPMDQTPLMLLDIALEMVWAPMVRILADALDLELEEVRTHVERRALERTVEVDGMGTFEEGTQGAFRFEVQGIVDGRPVVVVEHDTRIHDDAAPDWPVCRGGDNCYRVLLEGRPKLTCELDMEDEHGGDGGLIACSMRVVNAIPAVCAAPPGLLSTLDVPMVFGRNVRTA